MLTHRLRRTRRGPGWNSTVPWLDCGGGRGATRPTSRGTRFCPSRLARGVGHLAPTRVGPVADVLCSSAVSKIKPAFTVARRGTNPPSGNQLRRCTGALPFLKTPRRFHRMLGYAIRVISAFLGDLMTNAPHFGNQRTVFHFRFPKVRFSRKVCGVII